MLRIGWFATGRGEGSQKLLASAVSAIREGRLDAEIAFVFSNRERGQFPATDEFFDQVASYGIPLVTLSDSRFRREHGARSRARGSRCPRGARSTTALSSGCSTQSGVTSACSPGTC